MFGVLVANQGTEQLNTHLWSNHEPDEGEKICKH